MTDTFEGEFVILAATEKKVSGKQKFGLKIKPIDDEDAPEFWINGFGKIPEGFEEGKIAFIKYTKSKDWKWLNFVEGRIIESSEKAGKGPEKAGKAVQDKLPEPQDEPQMPPVKKMPDGKIEIPEDVTQKILNIIEVRTRAASIAATLFHGAATKSKKDFDEYGRTVKRIETYIMRGEI